MPKPTRLQTWRLRRHYERALARCLRDAATAAAKGMPFTAGSYLDGADVLRAEIARLEALRRNPYDARMVTPNTHER